VSNELHFPNARVVPDGEAMEALWRQALNADHRWSETQVWLADAILGNVADPPPLWRARAIAAAPIDDTRRVRHLRELVQTGDLREWNREFHFDATKENWVAYALGPAPNPDDRETEVVLIVELLDVYDFMLPDEFLDAYLLAVPYRAQFRSDTIVIDLAAMGLK
jgi:hypothetical protein